MWVLFSRGENFREEGSIAKNAKITPRENFHVSVLVILKQEIMHVQTQSVNYRQQLI